MTKLRTPKGSFGSLDSASAAQLISTAADVALVLDTSGAIQDVFVRDGELKAQLGLDDNWLGQDWRSKLSTASRPRATSLLADAMAGKPARWSHLNHSGPDGAEVPVLYAASPVKGQDRVVAFGRDLRPQALLQQRLIDAQQTMEQDHGRIRMLELRSRLLLHSAPDAVLVANATTQKITEANAPMAALVGRSEDLAGQPVLELFDTQDRQTVAALLATLHVPGGSETLHVHLANTTPIALKATPFREDGTAFVLLRALTQAKAPSRKARPETPDHAALRQLIEHAPDGFVVTDRRGIVLAVNAAFLAMVEMAQPQDAVGQSLDQWLGRTGVDLDVLLKNLRQRASVRLFATTLSGASGLFRAAEVSAVALEGETFGFAIRDVERRVADSRPGREMPRSVDQLTELIGRVPLKDLVREATDMIERLCIETALEMTNDNRASAAELLGLSRQSLYVKLRRYDLGDLTDEVL